MAEPIPTPPRRALIVRHVPREGLAGFRETVERHGYALERYDVPPGGGFDADLIEPDLLILMGGPMGVYETGRYPWLGPEIAAVRARLDADLPTLGICLGAQIMAAALGAAVVRSPCAELGFALLALTGDGQGSPLATLAGVPVLHWHSDVLDLPDGCERLASTPATPNQAFRRGSNLLALQFHAEMGIDPRIEDWIEESPDCIARVGTCAATLRAAYAASGPAAVEAGQAMIAEWLKGLRHHDVPVVELADTMARMAG